MGGYTVDGSGGGYGQTVSYGWACRGQGAKAVEQDLNITPDILSTIREKKSRKVSAGVLKWSGLSAVLHHCAAEQTPDNSGYYNQGIRVKCCN